MKDNKIELSEQQKMLLDNMASDMGHHHEWCFDVAPVQDIKTYGGYIPAMVFRDIQSYFSMNGPLYGDAPFIIGQNVEEARQRCKLMNEHIGLDDEMVEQILESTNQCTD